MQLKHHIIQFKCGMYLYLVISAAMASNELDEVPHKKSFSQHVENNCSTMNLKWSLNMAIKISNHQEIRLLKHLCLMISYICICSVFCSRLESPFKPVNKTSQIKNKFYNQNWSQKSNFTIKHAMLAHKGPLNPVHL